MNLYMPPKTFFMDLKTGIHHNEPNKGVVCTTMDLKGVSVGYILIEYM
jgi:hypothetical protein